MQGSIVALCPRGRVGFHLQQLDAKRDVVARRCIIQWCPDRTISLAEETGRRATHHPV